MRYRKRDGKNSNRTEIKYVERDTDERTARQKDRRTERETEQDRTIERIR